MGDFANFYIDVFTVPASVVYHFTEQKKRAVLTCYGSLNPYSFRRIYECILSVSKIFRTLWNADRGFIAMGNKINANINNVFTFVVLCRCNSFNFIKALITSVITFVLYKYLSRHLKVSA